MTKKLLTGTLNKFDIYLQHYKAVLLIPDVYNHKHVREMMNLLLDRLGFGAALVHQVGTIL